MDSWEPYINQEKKSVLKSENPFQFSRIDSEQPDRLEIRWADNTLKPTSISFWLALMYLMLSSSATYSSHFEKLFDLQATSKSQENLTIVNDRIFGTNANNFVFKFWLSTY